MIDAEQRERQRLERNLHDGAQQRLVSLSLELGLLEEQLAADPAAMTRLIGHDERSRFRSKSCATSPEAFTRP